VELAAGLRHPVELVASTQILRALGLSLDELEHEHALLGEVRYHAGSHPGFGRGNRVLVFVLAVDCEQARILRRNANDVRPPVGLDLVVRVREAAGELGDGIRAGELGNELENLVDLRAALHVA
jgi:hypothetical protein